MRHATLPLLSSPNDAGIFLQNSRKPPQTTTGIFLLGLNQANLPTPFGGTLLVLPLFLQTIAIGPGGSLLPGELPYDHLFDGLHVDMQVIEIDPAASHGYSFTPGLEFAWSNV